MLKGTFGGGFQVFQFPIRLFLQGAFGSFQCSGSLSIRIVIISRGTFLGRVVLTSVSSTADSIMREAAVSISDNLSITDSIFPYSFV